MVVVSVNTLSERHGAIISKIMIKAKAIAGTLGIHDNGYKLIINVGRGGGQLIFHIYLHLVGGWDNSNNNLI